MFIFTENYARSTNITHFLKDYPLHINVIVILIFITSTQFVLTSKVRILGLFCFCLFTFLVGLGRILLWAMKTTCLPENFFSNSRTNLVWIFWKALNWGTGTKMTIAFLPAPTSTSLAAVMFNSLKWLLRSEFISKSSKAWEMDFSKSSGLSPLGFTILARPTKAMTVKIRIDFSWWKIANIIQWYDVIRTENNEKYLRNKLINLKR